MKKICSTLFVFSAVLFSQNFVKADSTCNEKPVQGTTYTAGACIDTINVCMALGEPTPGEHPESVQLTVSANFTQYEQKEDN